MNITEKTTRMKANPMIDLPLLDIITAYGRMKVLAVACELKLFSLISDEASSVETLAESIGAKPTYLKALLDTCVSMNLLRYDQGIYGIEAVSDTYLVEERPHYIGNLIHIFSVEVAQWEGLYDLVMYGRPPECNNDTDAETFTMGMHALGMLGEAQKLVERVVVGERKEMVDVGCGSGIYSIMFCQRNPQLRATLLDKQDVLEVTTRVVGKSDIGERINLRASDIFEDDYGENRDVVLLSDVLFKSESDCKNMLSSAFRALIPGGLLIVRGYYSDPEGGKPFYGTLFDLNRMLWGPKRGSISVSIVRDWVKEVGFDEIEVSALTEFSTMLLAEKP